MLIDRLNGLLVSCQPVPEGPMDTPDMVVGFARAAEAGGATALRIESVRYLRAVRPNTELPIVGIVKRDLDDSEIRITPFLSDVEDLADAGADIIAFDATDRPRPVPVAELIAAIHSRGRLAMADCSSLPDAERALALGADIVGTTLSGYTGGPVPDEPDFSLISAMRRLTPHVTAEGRIKTPAHAAEARRRGAWTVVVGSALTRTEHATAWFKSAVESASVPVRPALAIDIGGTKILAALVEGSTVSEHIRLPTSRDEGPDAWIAALANRTTEWRGRYASFGIAVTGLVTDGTWSALNPATLGIPQNYPLVDRLNQSFGVPVTAANDAQAAAWAEYRFGAGQNQDLVFLTISTGIGGGIVVNGRLLQGLAGHYGILRLPSSGQRPFEDDVSGRWMASAAAHAGYPDASAQDVFVHAASGEDWARAIIITSARQVALLCQDIQLTLDPQRIVIGGGIGLADGFLAQVEAGLPDLGARLRPKLVPAALGMHAGVIGVADLATKTIQ